MNNWNTCKFMLEICSSFESVFIEKKDLEIVIHKTFYEELPNSTPFDKEFRL